MPPPSQLVIATNSVRRLLKEEASYHKELAQQQEAIKKLEEKTKSGQGNEDDNAEYMLKQQVGQLQPQALATSLLSTELTLYAQQLAVDQTKAVFGPLRERIDAAVEKLEEKVALEESSGAPDAEIEQAKAALEEAKSTKNGSA
ncbi:hypothetical protein B0I35DRAFT_473671 [Stachybotrys elegans]|uniref:Tubulin-specific chaperone A n=1 Tax=Stachybotrys elegans TaxID=80388 RepID=A0A8K0WWU1_9HYPO|nr:hypothetical protein B0I35DRAFT_473671 [Stachybotrys elegans]